MTCSAPSSSYAAVEQIQIAKPAKIREALDGMENPTLKKTTLKDLSIVLGPELNIGDYDRTPADISGTFFLPCDWPQEALELVPDLWDIYCFSWMLAKDTDNRSSTGTIRDEIRLRVPCRDFYPRPWHPAPYYSYYARFALFAPVESELPHASCFVLDSVMKNQTGRLTQTYFDGKLNMLVMRQSRTLDLSGAEPSQDAWTLLRWIASQPVGETRYMTTEDDDGAVGRDPANLTPGISV
ncbi:hypothetical protein NLG97_g4540 [Lecanicillium saksenae]|uniref:Uncharacterized protein n=1 Tax=Lecanicillium saksenae TaxID=468837 RepID=A0ACC1QWQ2_9HYPO|nr:hypothetical protein NLG97_g4540 [Lecanicillium saksenae]